MVSMSLWFWIRLDVSVLREGLSNITSVGLGILFNWKTRKNQKCSRVILILVRVNESNINRTKVFVNITQQNLNSLKLSGQFAVGGRL